MIETVGVDIGFRVKWRSQFAGNVFEELSLALQALGLIGVEGREKLLVGKEGQVQHGAEQHRGQAQRIEQLNAETASGRVEDSQHRGQQNEDEASDKQAGTGPAEVMRNGHRE